MAIAASLSRQEIEQIAVQIGPFLELAFGADAKDSVTLGESFELWTFRGVVTDPDTPFASRIEFAGELHHQLFVAGVAAGIAQSRKDPRTGNRAVTRIARSLLASYIDQALGDVDHEEPEPVPVCLLKASAYHLSALWVRASDRDRLYVVSSSPFLRSVPRKRFIDPQTLVRGLAQDRSSFTSSTHGQRQAPAHDRGGDCGPLDDDVPIDL
jgi:hypothetical protein